MCPAERLVARAAKAEIPPHHFILSGCVGLIPTADLAEVTVNTDDMHPITFRGNNEKDSSTNDYSSGLRL